MTNKRRTKYCALERIVKELGSCNGMYIKSLNEWPELKDFGYDIAQLSEQARRLEEMGESQVYEFVDGDCEAADVFAEEHNMLELHKFLDAVFEDEIQLSVW